MGTEVVALQESGAGAEAVRSRGDNNKIIRSFTKTWKCGILEEISQFSKIETSSTV